MFYAEPADAEAITNLAMITIWQSINLLLIHLVITKWGIIYVNSEILAEGNLQLLENIEEGVLILEEESLDQLFLNKSAKNINI